MKHLIFLVFLFCPLLASAQVVVDFKLVYDPGSGSYILSMRSDTPLSGPLARMSSSTQVSIVAPSVPGGWQVTDLTGLQNTSNPLSWQVTPVNAPAENPAADYLFFTPLNAGQYTTFPFPEGVFIDIFSFKSGSGCAGNLALLENDNDPLHANGVLNINNNIVILGAGPGNSYGTNEGGGGRVVQIPA